LSPVCLDASLLIHQGLGGYLVDIKVMPGLNIL
jgi:hypothetical protein